MKAPGVRTPISLAVRSGEIVGLFGLVGAGRSELMKGMFGGTQITAGQVYIDQQPIDIRKPSHAIAAGMMLCPEDRKAEGIIPCTPFATISTSVPDVHMCSAVV